MTTCKLCQQEIKGHMLGCSKGTICMKCLGDIQLAETQPLNNFGSILWILAETFFRRGKGEEITFEKVWEENKLNGFEDLNLIKFADLWKKK